MIISTKSCPPLIQKRFQFSSKLIVRGFISQPPHPLAFPYPLKVPLPKNSYCSIAGSLLLQAGHYRIVTLFTLVRRADVLEQATFQTFGSTLEDSLRQPCGTNCMNTTTPSPIISPKSPPFLNSITSDPQNTGTVTNSFPSLPRTLQTENYPLFHSLT